MLRFLLMHFYNIRYFLFPNSKVTFKVVFDPVKSEANGVNFFETVAEFDRANPGSILYVEVAGIREFPPA